MDLIGFLQFVMSLKMLQYGLSSIVMMSDALTYKLCAFIDVNRV